MFNRRVQIFQNVNMQWMYIRSSFSKDVPASFAEIQIFAKKENGGKDFFFFWPGGRKIVEDSTYGIHCCNFYFIFLFFLLKEKY